MILIVEQNREQTMYLSKKSEGSMAQIFLITKLVVYIYRHRLFKILHRRIFTLNVQVRPVYHK